MAPERIWSGNGILWGSGEVNGEKRGGARKENSPGGGLRGGKREAEENAPEKNMKRMLATPVKGSLCIDEDCRR